MADISALQEMLSGVVPDSGFMLDNRSVLSHLQFIEQYARNVPYVPDEPHPWNLTWADYLFMNGNTPEKLAALYQDTSTADGNLPPHQAMLLALLSMLETPRALLNYFPDAHCDLYYRKQLQQRERAAVPSQVALAIELDSGMPEMMLPAGTLFAAGQDSQGSPVEFALDDALLANQSRWSDLRWCLPTTTTSGGTSAIVYDDMYSWPDEGKELFAPTAQEQAILTGRMLASSELTNDPAFEHRFTLTFASAISLDGLSADISSGAKWLPLTMLPLTGNTLTLSLPANSGEIAPPDGLSGAEFTMPVLRLSRKDGVSLPEITLVKSSHIGEGGVESGLEIVQCEQTIITPFGHAGEEQPVNTAQLFLGISDLLPGQTLSLFWKLNSPEPLTFTWQYLSADNRWQALDAQVIDDTKNLYRSGLWSVILPDDASNSAPAMPAGRYWFRAVYATGGVNTTETLHWPWLIGLISNGMTATLQHVTMLDRNVVMKPLPADTIRRPASEISGVSGVDQPWESWGGRPPESGSEFVTRVAQRLSHRNRALTWPDMMMLLKTTFPYVFDVMTPASDILTSIPALTTQNMTVIPLVSEKDNDDPLRPVFNASRLEAMSHFLQGLASPWQHIRVSNPRYRNIQLAYEVVFQKGVNPAWAERELRETLTAQYMPWSMGSATGMKLASRMDYYDLMATLQHQPYVDYVVSLTLDGEEHSVQGEDDQVLILSWPAPV